MPKETKETVMDLQQNPLGLRYTVCLMLLWLIHGYVYYGIWHHISQEAIKSHVYVCITDMVSKVLGLFLCVWTRQKRTVMASLMALNAFCCFGLGAMEASGESEQVISSLAQVSSFLVSGSWNILWLFSVEIIGPRARYFF